jgi:tetratricopeptide (TPR) repeat protein
MTDNVQACPPEIGRARASHTGLVQIQLVALLFFAQMTWAAQEGVQTYAVPRITIQTTGEGTMQLATAGDRLARAKALERDGDWQALLDLGERWTREEPDKALAWYVLGRANSELQRYPEAVAAYRKDISLDPDDPYAFTNLGNAFRNEGRYYDAMRAYRDALRRKPDCVRSWHNLGLTYFNLKGVAGVTQALDRLRQVDPELAAAWQKLAVEYASTRDERLARDALKVLASLDASRRERMFNILFDSL